MNKKTPAIFVAIAIVIAGLIVGFSVRTDAPAQNQPDVQAVTGPDMPYPYISVNGVRTWYNNQAFTSATTTPCAILSPAATSTLVGSPALSFSVSSTTTMLVTIAKAATPYATTTVLATSSIASGAQAYIPIATTTPVADSTNGRATLSDRIFAPNTYLVVGMQGGVGTFSPTGRCIANFQEVTNVQ